MRTSPCRWISRYRAFVVTVLATVVAPPKLLRDWRVGPAGGAGAAVGRGPICTSPADGWLISRNWSLMPVIPDPPAVTVQVPLETLSEPPELPMSWQV